MRCRSNCFLKHSYLFRGGWRGRGRESCAPINSKHQNKSNKDTEEKKSSYIYVCKFLYNLSRHDFFQHVHLTPSTFDKCLDSCLLLTIINCRLPKVKLTNAHVYTYTLVLNTLVLVALGIPRPFRLSSSLVRLMDVNRH